MLDAAALAQELVGHPLNSNVLRVLALVLLASTLIPVTGPG
jgi:hypothetical protein